MPLSGGGTPAPSASPRDRRPEGPTPRAGAILVLGVSGTSPLGHVAYVESVSPNGSFVVSEMNWWGVPGGGWNRVDYRTVTSMQDALGFIY